MPLIQPWEQSGSVWCQMADGARPVVFVGDWTLFSLAGPAGSVGAPDTRSKDGLAQQVRVMLAQRAGTGPLDSAGRGRDYSGSS